MLDLELDSRLFCAVHAARAANWHYEVVLYKWLSIQEGQSASNATDQYHSFSLPFQRLWRGILRRRYDLTSSSPIAFYKARDMFLILYSAKLPSSSQPEPAIKYLGIHVFKVMRQEIMAFVEASSVFDIRVAGVALSIFISILISAG